jgi:hypothetical protein
VIGRWGQDIGSGRAVRPGPPNREGSSQSLQHSGCAGNKDLFTAFVRPSSAQKLIEARESVADARGAGTSESSINQCVDPPLFGTGSLLAIVPEPSFNLGLDRFRFRLFPSGLDGRLW